MADYPAHGRLVAHGLRRAWSNARGHGNPYASASIRANAHTHTDSANANAHAAAQRALLHR